MTSDANRLKNLLCSNVEAVDNTSVMSIVTNVRDFIPGTTGWTVDDLDDPESLGNGRRACTKSWKGYSR